MYPWHSAADPLADSAKWVDKGLATRAAQNEKHFVSQGEWVKGEIIVRLTDGSEPSHLSRALYSFRFLSMNSFVTRSVGCRPSLTNE